ncbi:MAG: hypothetical protein EXX96DRAFT_622243 [Benjaminiella poitrasii]|nr:MAG: hypothetical protein EXX96DRAFT_622243 [Benjaminiella poitrasii]
MSYSKSQGKKQQESSNNGSHKQQNRNINNSNNNRKWANAAAGRTHAPATHNGPVMQDPSSTKLMHDRMLFLLGNLIGTVVEVTVKDGSKFKGIFHGASTEGELGIALKLAQKIYDPSSPIEKDKTNPNPIKNTLLIFSKDLVEMNAENLDLTTSETPDRNTFKTDSDISGKLDIRERELHKWTPDDALGLLEGDLESSNDKGNWDQFAANEKLFGLKTDFDEEIYTTPLNRSAPGYKDREKRAIQVANEIQKSTATNIHILEERGVSIDGMDEEDLYGAVVRDSNPNKYLPPALRKQNQDQNSKKMPPLSKLMTSDLPKSSGSTLSPIASLPRRGEANEKTNEKPTKRIETEVATTFKQFAMIEKDKLHAKKQALQKREKDGRLAELKAFHQSFKLNVPIPPDLVPLLSKGKKANSTTVSPTTAKKDTSPSDATTTTTSEDVKSSPTPTKVSSTSQKNKPTITDATATTPTPTTANTTTPTTTASAVSPSSMTTTATTTTTTTNASPKTTFKFNVKASSFKPNPSAAAFVPGGTTTATTTNHNNTDNDSAYHRSPHPKRNQNEPITMADAFRPPSFQKQAAHQVGPTWPFGHKSYRVQFSSLTAYDEDMYVAAAAAAAVAYPYGYPAYRYPPYVPSPQAAPYMSPPPPPPFVMPSPPFPQGFPSPQQRSPMMPPYQYHQGVMVRYPEPPVMMQQQQQQQRPVMMDMQQSYNQQENESSENNASSPQN